MSSTPEALKAKVLATVSSTPAPTRKRWLATQVALLTGGVLTLLLTAGQRGVPDLSRRPARYIVGLLLATGLCAGISSWILAGFALRVPGPSRLSLRWTRRSLLPALFASALGANLLAPQTLRWPTAALLPHLGCTLAVLVSGSVVGLLWILALRRADPVTPRVTALVAGATAGAWTSLAVSLQCSLADPLHALGAHVLPIALLSWAASRLGTSHVGLNTQDNIHM